MSENNTNTSNVPTLSQADIQAIAKAILDSQKTTNTVAPSATHVTQDIVGNTFENINDFGHQAVDVVEGLAGGILGLIRQAVNVVTFQPSRNRR